jgi:hypothetical protein
MYVGVIQRVSGNWCGDFGVCLWCALERWIVVCVLVVCDSKVDCGVCLWCAIVRWIHENHENRTENCCV